MKYPRTLKYTQIPGYGYRRVYERAGIIDKRSIYCGMKHLFFLLGGLLLFCHCCNAQAEDEKVVYILDSIPVVGQLDDADANMNPDDISEIRVIKNRDSLKMLGFGSMQGAIFIFTKGYRSRSDEQRKIPTTRVLLRKNDQLYLKGQNEPYSGPYIDYYLNGHQQGEGSLKDGRLNGHCIQYYRNGNVGSERDFVKGIASGTEKRYYENGALQQKGEFVDGKEEGVWEMYYPNGQVSQHTTLIHGEITGESITYYSNGRIKSRERFKNGKGIPDESHAQVYKYYDKGVAEDKAGDYPAAIKQYSKCIQIDSLYAEAWYARGTAELNDLQFDKALADFDQSLLLEPYHRQALGNRAFCRIRKYQFAGRTLSKNQDVTVLASKDMPPLPEEERTKICADLQKAMLLQEGKTMIKDAVKEYCPLK